MALLKDASSVADVLAQVAAPDLQDGSASESSKSGLSTSQASTVSTSSHASGVRPSVLRRRSKGKLKPVSSKRQLFRESQLRTEAARVKPKAVEVNVEDMLTDIDKVDASDFEAALDKQASVFDGSTEIDDLDYSNLDSLLADVGGADMEEFDMEGIDEAELGASLFDDPGLTDYLASTLPAPESPKPESVKDDPPTAEGSAPIPVAAPIPAATGVPIPVPIPGGAAAPVPIPVPMAAQAAAVPIPVPIPMADTVETQSTVRRKRKVTKAESEPAAQEYERKMQALSKVSDPRELAFQLMAEGGEVSISALVRYLGHFGEGHSRSDDCRDTSQIRRFFTFLEPTIRSMVGLAKFTEHIDADGDVVAAYVRFLDTGDSRTDRDDGQRVEISVDIAHDSEADSRLLAEETEATAKASKVSGFAGLKSGSTVIKSDTDSHLIKSAKKVKGFSGLQSTGKTIITVDKSEATELEAAARVTDSAYERTLAEQRAKEESERRKRKGKGIEVSASALAAKSMFQSMDAETAQSTPVPKSPKRRKRKKSAQE